MINPIYTKANYSLTIEVTKSVKEVFHHLLHDVSKFWPEELEGECSHLNDAFVFKTGDSHYSKNKVVELKPNKKLVWLVTESIRKTDNFDWSGTKMIFELTPKNNHTLLQFTYDGIVLEHESDRLAEICDFVIKEKLYNLIESFSVTITVPQSPHHVFNCIKDVPAWWSRDYAGRSSQVDDVFIVHHPGAHFSKQKLVELIRDQKMVWQVTESTLDWLQHDKQEWTNTKMIFDIAAQGDKTQLHFRHEGLVPEKECYARCEQGWTMVITDRLLNYITSGKSI